jgi:hypothetical protein
MDSSTGRSGALDGVLSDIGWGLALALTGIISLLPEGSAPPGAWFFGMAGILIVTNLIRFVRNGIFSGLSLVLSACALLAGWGQRVHVDLPVLALCLIIIGATLATRPIWNRRSL